MKNIAAFFEGHKKDKEKEFFLRNEAEKLSKTKDLVPKTNRKRTENKATEVVENKRRAKKQTENKPENKAGHLVENTQRAKKRGKFKPKESCSFESLL